MSWKCKSMNQKWLHSEMRDMIHWQSEKSKMKYKNKSDNLESKVNVE